MKKRKTRNSELVFSSGDEALSTLGEELRQKYPEMAEKFGLEFRIVDSTLLKELRRTRGIHTNPWTHFPRLIVSVDWLKRDLPML